ncbi:hypothetical protein PYK79_53945 [Streptomyces sp. ID05-04B]|uniref:hypothetical protein n=1 Tax=unclassified Streptomyces TaxID=2593676 RepID=UPI0020B10A63|nr:MULTISPECIES: hypothetical protein [unclassified Streptomyces]MDX5570417.1 hypothetical protein [Streptomyces sp. ID05-04B]
MGTVSNHLNAVPRKTEVRNRVVAIRIAGEAGRSAAPVGGGMPPNGAGERRRRTAARGTLQKNSGAAVDPAASRSTS